MDRFLIDEERFDADVKTLEMSVTPRRCDYKEADLIELGWTVMGHLRLRRLTVFVRKSGTEFEHRN